MSAPRSLAVAAARSTAGVHEGERLEALQRLDILDTPREEAFERVTRLIRKVLDVPIAVVSLIDAHRQWHKSAAGLDGADAAERKDTICTITIQRAEPLFIADLEKDPVFSDRPFVTGPPGIRSYAGVPLRTRDGHNVGTVCAMDVRNREFSEREREILVDLAQIAMGEMELRLLAGEDALTGALSRRAFKDDATRAIATAARSGNALSAVIFDLDHFKRINDTYGHATGDQVLRSVAAACRDVLRPSDLFGRVGGEEFALVLPQTPPTGAAAVAERLREAISAIRLQVDRNTIFPTASFGVAAMRAGTDSLDTLLAEADRALYEAKAAGRNRCVLAPSAETSTGMVRNSVLKAGLVHTGNEQPIACTVRTLSDEGAGVDVWNEADIPAKFELALPSEGWRRHCTVQVRTPRHVEVAFD